MTTDYQAAVKANTNLALSGGPLLRLNNLTNTRRSLARIVRMHARMEIPTEFYKAVVYGLNSLIVAWKTEHDLVVVRKEIDEIKEMLTEAIHAKN